MTSPPLSMPGVQPTVDPQAWTVDGAHRLLLWEAFVSGDAKRAGSDSDEKGHMRDAVTALMHFSEHIGTPEQMRGITTDHPLSTLGTALLWSDWTTDVDVLHQTCLVAKPETAYEMHYEMV